MFRQSLLSAARNVNARSFSSTSAAQLARVNIIGRLVGQPEVRETRSGKEYLRYTLATTDPLGPPNEDGTPAQPTSSFHSIFAFGETTVNRLRDLPKGTLMYVEGDFRVTRTPGENGAPPVDQWLIQHRNYNVLLRPKNDY
ncbi:ssDNA-binding protein, mitochondrial [Malassezia brasiliensis]|uniref:Single-stranded DNA-binding protein n=1 Tax=Malassezia brasiliensis TaxID=1821822 RepID=A0AAF0DQP3_9BASI|nr:ssDNA-binding protein, mitochondrial [Malassezia brasiliensis]